jgi:hypothetical protein
MCLEGEQIKMCFFIMLDDFLYSLSASFFTCTLGCKYCTHKIAKYNYHVLQMVPDSLHVGADGGGCARGVHMGHLIS